MHKFQHSDSSATITIEVAEGATLAEMVAYFTEYLRVSGYVIPDGTHLKLIEDPDWYDEED